MKTLNAYLRIVLFMVVAVILMEYTLAPADEWAIGAYPILWAVYVTLFMLAVGVEIIYNGLRSVMIRSMSEEARARLLENERQAKMQQWAWFFTVYKKLLGAKPLSESQDITLDHNYDGIRELDNKLPPWWLYGFYITIVFAGIYLTRYHIFDAMDQSQEYTAEVVEAEAAIALFKETAKDFVDASNVVYLSEKTDLNAGEKIFQQFCVACHKADGGGGIGPNLTDDYWILGGGIKNIFTTITEGGRDGKGMVSWSNELKPRERAQVASYVLSLQGTTPKEPKAAEGSIWVADQEQ